MTTGEEGAGVSGSGRGTRAAQGTSEGVTDLGSSGLPLLPVGVAIPAKELPAGWLRLTPQWVQWILTEHPRGPGEVTASPETQFPQLNHEGLALVNSGGQPSPRHELGGVHLD